MVSEAALSTQLSPTRSAEDSESHIHSSSFVPACHLACWTTYRVIITTSLQAVAENLSPTELLYEDLLEKQ